VLLVVVFVSQAVVDAFLRAMAAAAASARWSNSPNTADPLPDIDAKRAPRLWSFLTN
jgi:hypothetical protein